MKKFPNFFQDEGDWRCTALAGKESVEGGEGEETCCGLVVYVPKSYRVPTFLGWKLSDSKTLYCATDADVNFAE